MNKSDMPVTGKSWDKWWGKRWDKGQSKIQGKLPLKRPAITLLLLVLAGFGCAPWANAGSLYHEQSFRSLTADHKAYRPGDSITVMIFENSSASQTANTSTGRDAKVNVNLTGTGKSANAGVGANNQIDGTGRTARQGQVLAQITVRVQGVEPNGDLLIVGEQLLEVNNEKQQIKVQGRVRPEDISDANTVLSTRVADAKISYIGQGDLADRQRPSWWQRALTWFGA
jgi:flagellar L-ring protein precursor FlgH